MIKIGNPTHWLKYKDYNMESVNSSQSKRYRKVKIFYNLKAALLIKALTKYGI